MTVMTFIFFLVAIVLLCTGFPTVSIYLDNRKSLKMYGVGRKQRDSLFPVSRNILRANLRLPEENRPDANLFEILSALQIKHGPPPEEHFYYGFGRPSCTWHGPHHRRDGAELCDFCKDFMPIRDGLIYIKEGLERREHALKVSAVNGRLDEAKELVARLEEESQLINSVNKELESHG